MINLVAHTKHIITEHIKTKPINIKLISYKTYLETKLIHNEKNKKNTKHINNKTKLLDTKRMSELFYTYQHQ